MKLLVLTSPLTDQPSQEEKILGEVVRQQGHSAVLGSTQDISAITEAVKHVDGLLIEITTPSTIVGQVVTVSLQASKPVVLLTKSQQELAFFKNVEAATDKLLIIEYSDDVSLSKEAEYGLDFLSSAQDVRFNFFISPEQVHYLDWIARNKKLPRSVYLRQLIDTDMKDQDEYGE